VASVSTVAPYSGQMLHSFLEAGGIAAVTQMLRESRCSLTAGYTVNIIQNLMYIINVPGRRDEGVDLATSFFHSGEMGWFDRPWEVQWHYGQLSICKVKKHSLPVNASCILSGMALCM
jgi:hypothetical protein